MRLAPRNRWFKLLIAMLLVIGTAASTFLLVRPIVSMLAWLWPAITWRVPSRLPVVYLTFDDGPDGLYTPQILDILAQAGIKATFFVVGDNVQSHPDLVRRLCAEGHMIANHTMSLRRTISLSDSEFENDLELNEKLLDQFGCAQRLFRPAGGMIRLSQLRILERRKYRAVLGSAYAFDPYRPPTWFISGAIRMAIEPGAIIVLHDSGGNRSSTVRAIPRIIDAARERGLGFATFANPE